MPSIDGSGSSTSASAKAMADVEMPSLLPICNGEGALLLPLWQRSRRLFPVAAAVRRTPPFLMAADAEAFEEAERRPEVPDCLPLDIRFLPEDFELPTLQELVSELCDTVWAIVIASSSSPDCCSERASDNGEASLSPEQETGDVKNDGEDNGALGNLALALARPDPTGVGPSGGESN